MTNMEKVRNIFSILHDGTIISWMGDKHLLTLEISCQYLAERVDKTFNNFFIVLIEINKLMFVPWMNTTELEQECFIDFEHIFQAELEILSADIDNSLINVACNQHNNNLDYCGGTLLLSCQDIKIFDQNNNELTVDLLGKICKEYWDGFSNQ